VCNNLVESVPESTLQSLADGFEAIGRDYPGIIDGAALDEYGKRCDRLVADLVPGIEDGIQIYELEKIVYAIIKGRRAKRG
jgi:hypothetical protein